MERKAEAYELVRKGVKQDIKSHVCWHVYGLLYRSDREYLQAIKCYRGALRHDKDNIQILRDLSLLQVQMRDLPGFVQTRNQLLTLKPTNRNNWFSFALARHLSNQCQQAIGIVESYEKTLEGTAVENEYEHSEMLLFKNMLIEESGDAQRALDHLDASASLIVDKQGMKEKRGELLLQLGMWDDADALYSSLLCKNSENGIYHAGRQAAALQAHKATAYWQDEDVPPEAEAKLNELYAALQAQFPRSEMSRRLPCDFARGEAALRTALTTYCLPVLRKGVPSLYANLKPLAKAPWRAAAMGKLFGEWLAALEKTGCLPGEAAKELPLMTVWVRVLVAMHADMCGDRPTALAQLEEAIEHTPTLVDLYMFKARVHKHSGDLQAAADWMDAARGMDLADRYLNTKATRYLLRADRTDAAIKTIALFTKDGETGISNLFDMQCMWWELESAASYLRQGDVGRALKAFTSVEKHFSDIVEDQFDFHTYCVRKMTLRAYVRMLRLEDSVWGHAFYVKAAHGVLETYLRIVDKSTGADGGGAEGGKDGAAGSEADDAASAAERKKAESKRKKAEAKARAEAEAKAAEVKAEAASGKGGKNNKGAAKEKPVDEDPDGVLLATAADPLERASSYLRTLQLHARGDLATHTYAYELATRKKKPLLALRALLKAKAIAPGDAAVAGRCKAFLATHVDGAKAPMPEMVAKVIALQRAKLA